MKALLARQFAHPSGFIGRAVLSALNVANAPLNRNVLEHLALRPGEQILEVGFGGGELIEALLLRPWLGSVIGVDRSALAVKRLRARLSGYLCTGTLVLHEADAHQLPCDAHSIDKVCSVNTLYLWPDLAAVLGEFRRVLIAGGRLVLAYRSQSHARAGRLDGAFYYRASDISAALQDGGFGEVEVRPSARQRSVCIVAHAV